MRDRTCDILEPADPVKVLKNFRFLSLVYLDLDFQFLFSAQIDDYFCQKIFVNKSQQYWGFDDFLEVLHFGLRFTWFVAI